MIALLITALAPSVSFAAAICSNAESSLSTACDAQHEEALDLLQRKSLALQGAHHALQGELSKSPVATFKSFTDSQCTTATGEDAIIALEEDACVFGWTFTCSCQGHTKVLIGKKYKSLSCNPTEPPEEHVVPSHTCVPAGVSPMFSGNMFMNVTDDSCPCCGASCSDSSGQESLLAKEKERVVKTTRACPTVGVTIYPVDGCLTPPVVHFDILADGKTPFGETEAVLSCTFPDDETKVLHISWPNGHVADIPDGQCQRFDCGPGCGGVMIPELSACSKAGQSTCTVHGDPHITVFDQAEVSLLSVKDHLKQANVQQAKDVDDIFSWGDFWLVKSEQVQVQARYRKVYYPKASQPLNNTYLTAVAIGGPFMQGYKLIVEPRSGSVTWADAAGNRKLLGNKEVDAMRTEGDADEDFVFEHEKLVKAVYSNSTPIVPQHGQGLVRGLDVELPSKVKLFIDRFAKHLDMRIEMTALAGGTGGVDGQCGNFNGDATDDTAELIEKRFGYPVPKDELLFD